MTLPQHEDVVRSEWIDSNGHMNLAYYVVVFDHATDVVFEALGIGTDYRRRTGNSSFVVETHTLYEREALEGERLVVRSRLLGADAKRVHLFLEMFRPGESERLAAQELMCLHVDMRTRRAAPFAAAVQATLAATVREGAGRPLPPGVGRRIMMPSAAPVSP